MNIISKTKSISSETFSNSISFSEKIVNPKRDWNILMMIFVILVLSSVGFDFYMYKQIASGDMYISVKTEDLSIQKLKSNDLKNILDNFENKKARIMNSKLEISVDPSL